MKLFMIHCGFYDEEICSGIYESHINLFSVGETIEEAKSNIRKDPLFQRKKMHIDGIQEIGAVGGYSVRMEECATDNDTPGIKNHLYRDL